MSRSEANGFLGFNMGAELNALTESHKKSLTGMVPKTKRRQDRKRPCSTLRDSIHCPDLRLKSIKKFFNKTKCLLSIIINDHSVMCFTTYQSRVVITHANYFTGIFESSHKLF